MHEENAFITLTYDDEHLPELGSLKFSDFQKFIRRFRKKLAREDMKAHGVVYRRLRFYHCGEYGDKEGRPHFHAILFGYDFTDKCLWVRGSKYQRWRSAELDGLWGNNIS